MATAGSIFFIWKPFYLLYQEFHFAFEEKTLIQWEVIVVIVMWLSLINYGNQFRSLAVYNILCSLFRSLETLERDGWANNTPWYITELISNDTTKELSPESPAKMKKKAYLIRVHINNGTHCCSTVWKNGNFPTTLILRENKEAAFRR